MDANELRERWAELYDDKFPNNNVVDFNEETGEYHLLTVEERKERLLMNSQRYKNL